MLQQSSMSGKTNTLYQIFYKPGDMTPMEGCVPLDNRENPRPDLREYYIFDNFVERLIDECPTDRFGFISPKFEAKTRIKPVQFLDFANKVDSDVVIYNMCKVQEAMYYNVWVQGDRYHPGISKLFSEMTGIDPALIFNTRLDWCFSSYFIASKHFWKGYLYTLRDLKTKFDSRPKNDFYHGSAGYDDPTLNYWPFFVERWFSTYLFLQKNYVSVEPYPYDYQYLVDLGFCNQHYANTFDALSRLKMQDINKWIFSSQLVRTRMNDIVDP